MLKPIYLVCLCVMLCSSIKAARILAVFPTPTKSHQIVFRPLTRELVRRGHEVVVITTDPEFPKGQAPENLTEIDVRDSSYGILQQSGFMQRKMGDKKNANKMYASLISVMIKIMENQTAVAEVRDIMDSNNYIFDLLLVEGWTRCTLGFSHVIKVPVIAMNSLGAIVGDCLIMGCSTHPILFPTFFNYYFYNLTRWQEMKQYLMTFDILYKVQQSEVDYNAALRRMFGENTPRLSELNNNMHMLFMNSCPIWANNFPVPPGVLYTGGVHLRPLNELPQALKQYLDSSVHGVIYVSFGTVVDPSLLPADKVQAMINVFSQLPYDVLWKWNRNELPGRTKNIKFSKWFPQADLLRHPKIKLFITHGGLGSTDETIGAAVPVIGIPMLFDQWYNIEQIVLHKIGRKIELDDLEEESLKSAIKIIIEDKSYRENMVRFRTIMLDQRQSSLERQLWWTEYVLRCGGARHLRAPAANMGWAEYYEIELVLIVLTITITSIILASLALYNIVKRIFRMQVFTSITRVNRR